MILTTYDARRLSTPRAALGLQGKCHGSMKVRQILAREFAGTGRCALDAMSTTGPTPRIGLFIPDKNHELSSLVACQCFCRRRRHCTISCRRSLPVAVTAFCILEVRRGSENLIELRIFKRPRISASVRRSDITSPKMANVAVALQLEDARPSTLPLWRPSHVRRRSIPKEGNQHRLWLASSWPLGREKASYLSRFKDLDRLDTRFRTPAAGFALG